MTESSIEPVILITAVEVVVACLSVEAVVRTVADDDVVTRASVDVFDGDETVCAVACVLALGGGEPDDVVSSGELSSIGTITTINGVVACSTLE